MQSMLDKHIADGGIKEMTSTSLPSINPQTIAKIKLALTAYGTDAELLVKLVESIMKVTTGSGYGKVTVYLGGGKVTMIRAEETHSISKVEEQVLDNS